MEDAEGKSIGWFRSQFDKIVADHGWDYKGGRDWRTKVIYRQNMLSSYAAGRWQQLNEPELLKFRPFWQYHHNDAVTNPRPEHLAWNSLVLRADDPWWKSHFPPNGWLCRCYISAVGVDKFKGQSAPDDGTSTYIDRYGEAHIHPKGVDYGFDYAPGASFTQDFIANKAASLPAPLAKDFLADMASLDTGVAKNSAEFVPQKSVKELEKYLVTNNIVDVADFGKIKDVALANEWSKALFDTIKEFPELRKNQLFTGSCQAQYSLWHKKALEKETDRLLARGAPKDSVDSFLKRNLKKPKVTEKWAHSWKQADVSGIAINEKYAASNNGIEELNKGLARSLETGFHPIACDTIKSIVDHELGHQLDDLLLLSKDNDIIGLFNKLKQSNTIQTEVSGYANKNIAEFIAEGWAEFRNNPVPRATAKRLGDIIKSKYAAIH